MSRSAPRLLVDTVKVAYGSTPFTVASGYNQIVASARADANFLEVFDSSGVTLQIGYGPAAGEADGPVVFPNGNPAPIAFPVSKGQRLAIKATDADATVGQLLINFYA